MPNSHQGSPANSSWHLAGIGANPQKVESGEHKRTCLLVTEWSGNQARDEYRCARFGLEFGSMRVLGAFKIAIVLLLASGGVTAVEFAPELYSIGWHRLHRGVAHFKSEALTTYEMRVPPTFSAYRPDECSVSVLKQAGPIRSRLGWRASSKMSFSACPIYTTAKEIEANAPKLRDELGILTVRAGNNRHRRTGTAVL